MRIATIERNASAMILGRRAAGRGLAAALAAAANAGVARATPSTAPDVVVYSDRALRGATQSVGQAFTARGGTPVHVFCAPPSLMLAQIERVTQNDILITGNAMMDQAMARGLITSGTRIALGTNRLVLAGRGGGADPISQRDAIRRLIGEDPLGAPDRTSGTTLDSNAVLARLGLTPPLPFRLVGAIDTEEVAWLARAGAVKLGLLYRTQAQSGSDLAVAAVLPEEEPVSYSAAITVVTRSPRADAFMNFLRSVEAAAVLRAAGLEAAA